MPLAVRFPDVKIRFKSSLNLSSYANEMKKMMKKNGKKETAIHCIVVQKERQNIPFAVHRPPPPTPITPTTTMTMTMLSEWENGLRLTTETISIIV